MRMKIQFDWILFYFILFPISDSINDLFISELLCVHKLLIYQSYGCLSQSLFVSLFSTYKKIIFFTMHNCKNRNCHASFLQLIIWLFYLSLRFSYRLISWWNRKSNLFIRPSESNRVVKFSIEFANWDAFALALLENA